MSRLNEGVKPIAGDVPSPGFFTARLMSNEDVAEMAATIDLFSLPAVYADQLNNLPRAGAVYFLILHDEVIYVGQSWNLALRWRRRHKHFNSLQQPGARLAYLVVNGDRPRDYFRIQMELIFINRLRPLLNKQMRNRNR